MERADSRKCKFNDLRTKVRRNRPVHPQAASLGAIQLLSTRNEQLSVIATSSPCAGCAAQFVASSFSTDLPSITNPTIRIRPKHCSALILGQSDPKTSPKRLFLCDQKEENQVQGMESCDIFHYHFPVHWLNVNSDDCFTE